MHILRNIRVVKPVCTRRPPGPKYHKQAYHLTCEVVELHVVLLRAWPVYSKLAKPTAGILCIYRETCSSLPLEMVFKIYTHTHTHTHTHTQKSSSTTSGLRLQACLDMRPTHDLHRGVFWSRIIEIDRRFVTPGQIYKNMSKINLYLIRKI